VPDHERRGASGGELGQSTLPLRVSRQAKQKSASRDSCGDKADALTSAASPVALR
jgi:hypothetical protein